MIWDPFLGFTITIKSRPESVQVRIVAKERSPIQIGVDEILINAGIVTFRESPALRGANAIVSGNLN